MSPSKFTLESQTTPARTSRTSSSPVNATLKSSFYFGEVHVETHKSWCLKYHVFSCLVSLSWPDCQRGFVLQWQLCQMRGYRGFWVKVRTHWTGHLICMMQFVFFVSPKKKNWLPHEQVNHDILKYHFFFLFVFLGSINLNKVDRKYRCFLQVFNLNRSNPLLKIRIKTNKIIFYTYC